MPRVSSESVDLDKSPLYWNSNYFFNSPASPKNSLNIYIRGKVSLLPFNNSLNFNSVTVFSVNHLILRTHQNYYFTEENSKLNLSKFINFNCSSCSFDFSKASRRIRLHLWAYLNI